MRRLDLDSDKWNRHVRVSQTVKYVVTTVKRTSTEVRALKHALIKGDTNRPSLPEGVVEKILDMAEYWCCVEKECKTLFFCV